MSRQLATVAIVVAVAIVSAFGCAGAEMSVPAGEYQLRRTLRAVEAALRFMADGAESANLDGGIGVRTVEGQFGALLARYWTRLPAWAAARLRQLQVAAGRAGGAISDSVRRRTPAYFSNAGHMLRPHFWDVFFPTRRLPVAPSAQTTATAKATAKTTFTERFSDDCIREFFPSEHHAACSISQRCWDTMVLDPSAKGYFLTHQLFYLLNGIQANCAGNLSSVAESVEGGGQPLQLRLDAICSSVFAEALELERRGFPVTDRDLFMEQIGLCSLAGYTGFAQWRWWRPVIGWQRSSGCYGTFADELLPAENFDSGRYGNYRRKRSERAMSAGGCLSHRTSVALDALVAFVRRLVEDVLLLRQ